MLIKCSRCIDAFEINVSKLKEGIYLLKVADKNYTVNLIQINIIDEIAIGKKLYNKRKCLFHGVFHVTIIY
jgi:hypothetical protein